MPLPSEVDDEDMGAEVRQAFAVWLEAQGYEPDVTDCFYEHGHWWARASFYEDDDNPERTWSVVDVEIRGENGFDFEEI